MNNINVSDILKATGGKLIQGDSELPINGISTDTRSIKHGEIFFALEGKIMMVTNLLEQAIHNGAAGAVISSGKKSAYSFHNGFKKCALLEVADTLRALGDLAKFYRNSLPTSFIAVTGSNGKTTTKDMAYHVLGNFKSVSRSRKSFNNFIGVPLTIFETEITHDFCIVEMGTNAPGRLKGYLKLYFLILPF
jgi:UDP-N-acetylmuramoyl-tripeptide--D-alanyl-D-alanine ligase